MARTSSTCCASCSVTDQWENRGDVLLAPLLVVAGVGGFDKADANFRQGLKLSPKDPELNNNYGWYLCQTGRQRESIRYFDVADGPRPCSTGWRMHCLPTIRK